jgi:hypothetical protein
MWLFWIVHRSMSWSMRDSAKSVGGCIDSQRNAHTRHDSYASTPGMGTITEVEELTEIIVRVQ